MGFSVRELVNEDLYSEYILVDSNDSTIGKIMQSEAVAQVVSYLFFVRPNNYEWYNTKIDEVEERFIKWAKAICENQERGSDFDKDEIDEIIESYVSFAILDKHKKRLYEQLEFFEEEGLTAECEECGEEIYVNKNKFITKPDKKYESLKVSYHKECLDNAKEWVDLEGNKI